ncbi:hypothetical protein B484DRAFT_411425, partial [Ochromonadaceae sp. CCMP2298]
VFTSRGLGFFFGTLASAQLAKLLPLYPKHYLAAVSILLSGLASYMLSQTADFHTMCMMAAMQGAGFGGVHTFATLALMTMWGQRVQPWMQPWVRGGCWDPFFSLPTGTE